MTGKRTLLLLPPSRICVGKASCQPGVRLKVIFLPVKSTGVQFVLVLPRIKNHEKYDLPSTRPGIHHVCMRCIAGLDLLACMVTVRAGQLS
jgi:hypothetical protein